MTYSNKNAHNRRSNLDGAVVRLADPGSYEFMTELIALCQDRFNFTLKDMTWSSGLRYDGAIDSLLDDKLDFGKEYLIFKTILKTINFYNF